METISDDFYFTGWSMRALMALFVALAPVGRPFGDGRGARGAGGRAATTGPQRRLPAAMVGGVAAGMLLAVGLARLRRRRSHAG